MYHFLTSSSSYFLPICSLRRCAGTYVYVRGGISSVKCFGRVALTLRLSLKIGRGLRHGVIGLAGYKLFPLLAIVKFSPSFSPSGNSNERPLSSSTSNLCLFWFIAGGGGMS